MTGHTRTNVITTVVTACILNTINNGVSLPLPQLFQHAKPLMTTDNSGIKVAGHGVSVPHLPHNLNQQQIQNHLAPLGAHPQSIAGQPPSHGRQSPSHSGQPPSHGGQSPSLGRQPPQLGGQPLPLGGNPASIGAQPVPLGAQPALPESQSAIQSGQPQESNSVTDSISDKGSVSLAEEPIHGDHIPDQPQLIVEDTEHSVPVVDKVDTIESTFSAPESAENEDHNADEVQTEIEQVNSEQTDNVDLRSSNQHEVSNESSLVEEDVSNNDADNSKREEATIRENISTHHENDDAVADSSQTNINGRSLLDQENPGNEEANTVDVETNEAPLSIPDKEHSEESEKTSSEKQEPSEDLANISEHTKNDGPSVQSPTVHDTPSVISENSVNEESNTDTAQASAIAPSVIEEIGEAEFREPETSLNATEPSIQMDAENDIQQAGDNPSMTTTAEASSTPIQKQVMATQPATKEPVDTVKTAADKKLESNGPKSIKKENRQDNFVSVSSTVDKISKKEGKTKVSSKQEENNVASMSRKIQKIKVFDDVPKPSWKKQ